MMISNWSKRGKLLTERNEQNLNNAFVSGMKEDLKMYGTELNQINSGKEKLRS
jgi:hypothetical protein